MKDKVARERIYSLYAQLEEHQTRPHSSNPLDNVSIKDCPKCEHEVLARWNDSDLFENNGDLILASGYFQCLTCGVKFTCTDKCVCEVIDEDT